MLFKTIHHNDRNGSEGNPWKCFLELTGKKISDYYLTLP